MPDERERPAPGGDGRPDADLPGAGLPPRAPGRRTPAPSAGRRRTPRATPPPASPAAGPGSPPPGAEQAGPGASGAAGAGEVPGLPEGTSGPELARAVLDAALAQRRQTARAPRRRPGDGDGDTTRRRPRGYSGPGPDPRDPQLFGAVLARLMKARGWQKPAAEAMVFGAWERVVGSDIAAHSRPVKLENGELTVEAESTAWATQLRLLAASLIRRIATELGHNVVTKLHIHGPAAPSWNKGPRRVRGRGPRDTYG